MRFYDIFNGDADGLCALQQLRLAQPREATLVTGVKRDIALLSKVKANAGDELTVLDISLDANREPLLRALHDGARVRYFDHHFAGEIPVHDCLEAHIETSPVLCTSLIVDRHLGGRFRAWAVAAAFGDNLHAEARSAAAALNLSPAQVDVLRVLGECLNYNAYGRDLADLHFHPAELFARMRPFADPFAFVAQAGEIEILERESAADLQRARALPRETIGERAVVVYLPDEAWGRRIAGTFANDLARSHADRIVALLLRSSEGHQVSLRAPGSHGLQAHLIAQRFEAGNGRARAAGIPRIDESDLPKLMALLANPPATG
ncbi:MAG TPA: DHH family phosphoesterase [Burkholderiales bacterium]|nr:DHH family phosphoesterase [Burkholderiales bacterium]